MKKSTSSVAVSVVLALGALGYAASSLASAKAVEPKEGQKLYTRTGCPTCHGAKGRGDGPAARSLTPRPTNFTDKAYMSKVTDKQLFDAIQNGGPAVGLSASMPAYKNKLTKDQISDTVAYLRTLAGSKPAPKSKAKSKPAPKAEPKGRPAKR